MRHRLLLGLLLAFSLTAYCQNHPPLTLNDLDQTIEAAPRYDAEKSRNIELLKKDLLTSGPDDKELLFRRYQPLYEEYKVFNYDSAFFYARKLQETALLLNDPVRIVYARLKTGFSLLVRCESYHIRASGRARLSSGIASELFRSKSSFRLNYRRFEIPRS